MIGHFQFYSKLMIYENFIVSDDVHSTVFLFLDVHSTVRAVYENQPTVADECREIN